MLDGVFLWKHLWLDKRITKSEITTVSHNYPVNLHKDITKGGWGGWKLEGYDNNNYPQLSKAGSSAFTLSAVLSVIIETFIQNTLKKNPDRSSLPCVTKEKQSERIIEIFGKNCLITGFDISEINRKPCV